MSKMKNDEKNDAYKKNVERIDKDIINDIREYLGVEPDDTSKDEVINNMSLNQIFHYWCDRNGYINGSEKFKRVIGSIYAIDIEGRVKLIGKVTGIDIGGKVPLK